MGKVIQGHFGEGSRDGGPSLIIDTVRQIGERLAEGLTSGPVLTSCDPEREELISEATQAIASAYEIAQALHAGDTPNVGERTVEEIFGQQQECLLQLTSEEQALAWHTVANDLLRPKE